MVISGIGSSLSMGVKIFTDTLSNLRGNTLLSSMKYFIVMLMKEPEKQKKKLL
jgi:hypothetical protein